jgi:hypothetical protein
MTYKKLGYRASNPLSGAQFYSGNLAPKRNPILGLWRRVGEAAAGGHLSRRPATQIALRPALPSFPSPAYSNRSRAVTSSRTSRVAFRVSDAAFGGLVSIPDPEPLAIAGFDSCFTAQDDVDRVQYIAGDGFGAPVTPIPSSARAATG